MISKPGQLLFLSEVETRTHAEGFSKETTPAASQAERPQEKPALILNFKPPTYET